MENENVNENVQPTSEETEQTNSEVKVNKFYNLLSLIFAGVLFALEIFLAIAFNAGAFNIYDRAYNFSTINYYVGLMQTVGMTGDLTVQYVAFCWDTIFFAIANIILVVSLIATIIRFCKLVKLDTPYEERIKTFDKYAAWVMSSYAMATAVIAISRTASTSTPALGVTVIVFTFLTYAGISVFKLIFTKDGKFNLLELIIGAARKAVLALLALFSILCVYPSMIELSENMLLGMISSGWGYYDNYIVYLIIGLLCTCVSFFNIGMLGNGAIANAQGKFDIKIHVSRKRRGKGELNVGAILRYSSFVTLVYSIVATVVHCIARNSTGASIGEAIVIYLPYLFIGLAALVASFGMGNPKEEDTKEEKEA